jgi:Tfp pilus assembly protein PilV
MIFAIVLIGLAAVVAIAIANTAMVEADSASSRVACLSSIELEHLRKRVSSLEDSSTTNGWTVNGLVSAEGDFSNRLEALEEWLNLEYIEPEEVVGYYEYKLPERHEAGY